MRSSMLGMQSSNWHERATHSRGYADNDPATFAAWCSLWITECLRVLKPGGHMLAFGGTRTWHRLAVSVEDAGFEIRDNLAWLHHNGVPKSMNVARAIASSGSLPADARDQANDWIGWGTALKPAYEPIVMARKPLEGTVASNVVRHGTGALAIDANRLQRDEPGSKPDSGRWPTNVYLDAAAADSLDAVTGKAAAKYFWVAKPSKAERPAVDGTVHPTVKPLTLIRELVRLVTPPGGIFLDPFAGSGTTLEASLLEGRQAIGIEIDDRYIPLVEHRIDRVCSAISTDGTGEPEQLALFDDL